MDPIATIDTAHPPGAPAKTVRRSWFRWHGGTPSAMWLVVRRSTREFVHDRCTHLAAAIAYSALFSVIPIVALAVAAFGQILRVPEVRRSVVERVLENVPLQAGLVVDGIRAVSVASEPLTIVGLLGLVASALGMIGVVRDSLNVAWGVRRGRNPFRQRLFDLGTMMGLGLLLGVSILGTMALHTLRDTIAVALGGESGRLDFVWSLLAWVFPGTVTFLAFLFLYRFVPNVRHGFADVWPGALVGAVLFEIAKHVFTYYVANFDRLSVLYGALGAVLLFLLWVYVSAVVLLLGAEMASVYEKALRGRTATTRPHADLVLRPRPSS